jgi:hypothetical protein
MEFKCSREVLHFQDPHLPDAFELSVIAYFTRCFQVIERQRMQAQVDALQQQLAQHSPTAAVEVLLTATLPRCPVCHVHFTDFSACMAIKCTCKEYFCGACLCVASREEYGLNGMHGHVTLCSQRLIGAPMLFCPGATPGAQIAYWRKHFLGRWQRERILEHWPSVAQNLRAEVLADEGVKELLARAKLQISMPNFELDLIEY